MGLTPADRQKRYKEKMKQNQEKYEEYKKKKRENYHKKKRLVKDLTPQEKYNARVIWKLRKKNVRERQQNLNRVLDITPPSSPPRIQELLNLNINEGVDAPGNHEAMAVPRNETNKKSQTRKKVRRDRSKLYRDNLKLKEQIAQLKKECERYKKRCQRYGMKKITPPEVNEKTKYEKLSTAMKANYQRMKTIKEKRMLKNIIEQVDGPEKEHLIKESLGLKNLLRTSIKPKLSTTKLKKTILAFFLRDDISRATAGKKDTCTIDGQKMQKRFLLETMKLLFKTFKKEHPEVKCSYFYFTKNKPRYIVKPSVTGREMCLCKVHTNPIYKARALKNKGVIDTCDINALVAATVCDPKVQTCMYGTCELCRDKKIEPIVGKDTGNIVWNEWGRVQELYEKDGKQMKAFKNVKKGKEGTVLNLVEEFNKEMKLLKKHIYNMKVQFHSFRQAVDQLQNTEAVIVVDFSENYSCKHHEEVQSHQFGGSRQQVSLHTVVVYVKIGDNEKKVESYCTVSSNTNHQPAAIWAHLHPLLDDIRAKYPRVTTVHFFSDGPFSQYRQKQNFYLSSTTLFDYGFTAMTWSFFEAGHGKGPADGIGGYLKRSADDLVARGDDISCANEFYDALKDVSKIRLYLISSADITRVSKLLPPKIQALAGTINVHQIYTKVRGEVMYRNLSCFCNRGYCDCLSPKVYIPVVTASSTSDKMIYNNVPEMSADSANSASESCNNIDAVVDVVETVEEGCHFAVGAEAGTSGEKALSYCEDDIPLSYLKKSHKPPLKEIELSDLCQPRQNNWYKNVYHTPDRSDDEHTVEAQQTCSATKPSSNKENRPVTCGDFLLVKVPASKGKVFKYACVVNDLHDDGELRVTFLRSVKNKKIYRLEKSDISDIDYLDIIDILPEPEVKTKRGTTYYNFPIDVAVLEQ